MEYTVLLDAEPVEGYLSAVSAAARAETAKLGGY